METELADTLAIQARDAEMECADVTPEGCNMDDDLFSGGRSRVKLTRSQKRGSEEATPTGDEGWCTGHLS